MNLRRDNNKRKKQSHFLLNKVYLFHKKRERKKERKQVARVKPTSAFVIHEGLRHALSIYLATYHATIMMMMAPVLYIQTKRRRQLYTRIIALLPSADGGHVRKCSIASVPNGVHTASSSRFRPKHVHQQLWRAV